MLKILSMMLNFVCIFFVFAVGVSSSWMNISFLMINWNWLSLFEKSTHSLGALSSLMVAGIFMAYLDLANSNKKATTLPAKKTIKKGRKKSSSKKKK